MYDQSFVGVPTGRNRFLEIFDGTLLALEGAALLVMEPSELLQHLGVVRVTLKHTLIGGLSAIILLQDLVITHVSVMAVKTYVFLLFMNVTDLEPDVFLRKRRRRRVHNVFEALEMVSGRCYC